MSDEIEPEVPLAEWIGERRREARADLGRAVDVLDALEVLARLVAEVEAKHGRGVTPERLWQLVEGDEVRRAMLQGLARRILGHVEEGEAGWTMT